MKHIVIIQGPSGSGKTNLAYNIAKYFSGEIINADSRQIYRYADIGTNKEKFEDIKTYLLDIRDPNEQYNAFEFKTDALQIIEEIIKKDKLPIVIGGTAFYIDILTGKRKLDEVNDKFKQYLEKREIDLSQFTINQIKELLESLDKEFFQSLNNSEQNNRQRLIKKIAIKEFYKNSNSKIDEEYLKGYNIIKIAIDIYKEELKDIILKRTDQMIDSGLKNEVVNIIKKFGAISMILSTIGYKEFIEVVGETNIDKIIDLNNEELNEIKIKIYSNTMKYIKRQITWLKADKDIIWIKKNDLSNKVVFEVIKKNLR